MKKILAVMFVLMLSAVFLMPANAKNEGKIGIEGHVRDSLLNLRLQGAMVYVLDSAGAVIDSAKADGKMYLFNKPTETAKFTLKLPRRKAQYTLEVTYPGYETVYRMLTLDNIGSREAIRQIPDIIMRKEPRKLGEVTVTATKVKFFNKGDTLVYNADAFQLAEGSMLDALIEQLPGVELKDDGRIFVNGKFVESLMLNGKEFMGENNKLLLENLGAYTVKNVAVYDKLSDRSEFLGRDDGDSQYVMDVKLKKEYDNGYVGNLEAGYGSRGRYMGRLFGMKYNNTSQVMVYGNINNLNDKRTPGRNSSWTPEDMQSGTLREKLAGVDYSYSKPDNSLRGQGNAAIRHSSLDDETVTNLTTLMPASYNYAYKSIRSRNLLMSTRHNVIIQKKRVMIIGDVYGSYSNQNNRNGVVSATFNESQQNVTREMIEDIYSTSSAPLRELVNRNLQTDSTSGQNYNVDGSIGVIYKMPKSSDDASTYVSVRYDNSEPVRYNDQVINYGRDAAPAYRLSQYAKNNPAHSFKLHNENQYSFVLTSGNITPLYFYDHEHRVKNSYLYALDRLEDNGIFGVLPGDYQSAFDSGNSYEGTHRTDQHRGGFRMTFNGEKWSIGFGPSVKFSHQSLDYTQGGQHFHITRNSRSYYDDWTTFTLYIGETSGSGFFKQAPHKISFNFYASEKLPQMEYLIDMPNTADPLFIYEGAPDLKNEQTWKWNLRYDRKPTGKRWMESIVADYNLTTNALVRGYSYDESTGVRRIRSYNTSGNWDAGVANILSTPIDRKGRVMLSSNTAARYGHATDMIGVNSQAPAPFTVKNLFLSENLKLSWNVTSKVTLGAKGDIQWRETRSERESFENIHALTANYGVTATAQLPLNFGVSTDLTLYTRSGYSIKELNTTDCVWNARLSYSADKGRWLFMVDGFDILHQLSNVNYSVTPQGQVVTYTNVLPKFFMVHVQYKLNIMPKKR
ncbi:MAG: carboxypeptidase-like regulatory domain-containing protein [Paramuribaculum sp.]|nr:carboxypeptidase-like regulatory domain-containing protein [Paramuribaculum sp.]